MNTLTHHGILGMHWGIRRFQNKDGTRTTAGKEREKNKVRFISMEQQRQFQEQQRQFQEQQRQFQEQQRQFQEQQVQMQIQGQQQVQEHMNQLTNTIAQQNLVQAQTFINSMMMYPHF